METNKPGPQTIDEYIAQFPAEVQEKLQAIRTVIRESAPDAVEKISWQMPTIAQHGNVVHFAAHKAHIGFYPGANGIEVFKEEFQEYQSSKGAVQFPFNKPMPLELVSLIVKFRVAENIAEAEAKAKAKKKK
jgi:uncharacterized protein YdhG (YjbR/CyaY superfamily)